MKISEFEEKLATVSDAKLMQMFSASRASGPDVAVKLILNEAKRRGMHHLEASDDNAFAGAPGSETSAYSHASAGYADADAPPPASAQPFRPLAGTPSEAFSEPGSQPLSQPDAAGDLALDPGAPATAPEWLSEETKPGLPIAVKVLMVLVVLGAALGVAWKFSH
jgi:hypothetical protein